MGILCLVIALVAVVWLINGLLANPLIPAMALIAIGFPIMAGEMFRKSGYFLGYVTRVDKLLRR